MKERLRSGFEKAKQLQQLARDRSKTRVEHLHEHYTLLRDLAELAFRSVRRRRYGDGHDHES